MLGSCPEEPAAARRQAQVMTADATSVTDWTPAPGDELPDTQRRFVEGIAQYYYDNDGMPFGRGRTIGWLIISEPRVQPVGRICQRLDVSREDVDWVARQLAPAKVLIRHETGPDGDYALEMGDTAWVDRMQDVFSKIPAFHQILAGGAELLAGAPPQRRHRVANMERFFGYLATEIPTVFDRYRATSAGAQSA